MSQYMPYGGFKWLEPTLNGLNTLTETSEIGQVYEVDISYPQHLHDLHTNLLFLSQKCVLLETTVQKLIATLNPKNNYVMHYRNLKQLISNGLVVEKFKQSPWVAEYISLNTKIRKKAANDFEKDFYKLMNNAVFGKTMENMRKRIKMVLVTNESRVQKLINKPTFKYCTIYDENLTTVSLKNKINEFCFPVLDISKTLMHDYHDNVMKAHYMYEINLMYTDTNSLIYIIQSDDYYQDLLKYQNLLDRMDLPRDHPRYVVERKKVPEFFSDESDRRTITEFCVLHAKSVAYKINGVVKIKAKGIQGYVVKNHMTF